MTRGSRHKLLKATASGFLANFGGAIVTFITVPILLKQLGPNQFGEWSICLFFSFSFGVLGLVDVGVTDIVQRAFARNYEKSETFLCAQDDERVIISSARVYMTRVLVILGSFVGFLMTFTSLGPSSLSVSIPAQIVSFLFFVLEPILESQNSLVRAELDGRFEHAKSRVIELSTRVFQSICLIGVAFANPTVYLLLACLTTTSVIRATAYRRISGKLRTDYDAPGDVVNDILGLLRRCKGFASLKILGVMYLQLDKAAVIIFLGTPALASYEVVFRLQSIAVLFLTSCSTVVFATSAEAQSKRNVQRVEQLYDLGSRLTLTLLIPVTISSAVFADQILNVVFGQDYEGLWIATSIALVIPLFTSVNHLGIQMLSGMEHERWIGRVQTRSLVVNLVVTVVLVPLLGISGVFAGSLVGIGSVWYTYFRRCVNELLSPTMVHSWRLFLLKRVIISIFLVTTLSIVIHHVFSGNSSRWSTFGAYAIALLTGVFLAGQLLLRNSEKRFRFYLPN